MTKEKRLLQPTLRHYTGTIFPPKLIKWLIQTQNHLLPAEALAAQ